MYIKFEGRYDLPEWDDSGLNNNSWETIRLYAKAGKLKEVAKIGDYKIAKTRHMRTGGIWTEEDVIMNIASINDGTGIAGAFYPYGTVDFISSDYVTDDVMNHTNSDYSTTNIGWKECAARLSMNGYFYKNCLSEEIKRVITPKTHMYVEGNGSTNLVSSTDFLWFPTQWEVCGELVQTNGELQDYNKQYELFKNPNIYPRSCTNFWTSTPYSSNTTDYVTVRSFNPYYRSNARQANIGWWQLLCFRI